MSEPASQPPMGIPVGPPNSTNVVSFSPLANGARELAEKNSIGLNSEVPREIEKGTAFHFTIPVGG